MGFLSSLTSDTSTPPRPLAPAPMPIGVLPYFTQHTEQIALKVREHKMSLSGDDFTIKDAVSGQIMFLCDAASFSFRGEKTILDARGQPLFQIRKKIFAVHSTFIGSSIQSGEQIFQVKSGWSWGRKLTTTFTNLAGDGKETELILRGSILDRSAEISTTTGVPVARISRQFMNAGELIFGKQTYILTIAPKVDAALLLAVCICLVSNNPTLALGSPSGID